MYTVRHALAAVVVALGLLLHPAYSTAANLELSATAKKALVATMDKATRDTAARIRAFDGEFRDSQQEELRLETSIKALRTANSQTEAKLRQNIRNIDHAKIQQLEQQLLQTKARYKPLFDSYTALNKQIAAVQKLKNKELSKMLRTQADILQVVVQAARQDIRNKNQALGEAKTIKNRKMAELRKALDGIKPLQEQIKTQKSAVSDANKRKSAAWKSLNEQIKKQDAPKVAAGFSTLAGISGQIVGHKREAERLELRISQLLRDANKRLAAA